MIRRAEKKDIPKINNLLFQVLSVHAKGRPDIFIPGTKKYSDAELVTMFQDDTRPVFVYTDADSIVRGYAFCIFEEVKNVANMRDMKTLYIDDICVDQEYRRHGIAKALYQYVLQFAKESGCYRVTLNVWAINNAAQAFYNSMGMKPLKTVMEQVL